MKPTFATTLLVLLTSPLLAQTPLHTPTPAPASSTPALTELEHLTFENLMLKDALLHQQEQQFQQNKQQLMQQEQEFLTRVQKEHPGYTLDTTSGELVLQTQKTAAPKRF